MDRREVRTRQKARRPRIVERLVVRVESGPDAGAALSSDGAPTISVGASPDNDLVLADPTVSRYHLELRPGRDGVLVSDLGSRNGTWLGGVRIDRAVVPAHSRISLGHTVLHIGDARQGAAPADPEAPRIEGLIGESGAMSEVARLVDRLAAVPSSVLIQGETGVGKEVVAEAVHRHGPRREGPFVVVDCGSMPATLVASQLFGHERGAFTGAEQRRQGAFERAHGGTVLLDEIGELPLEIQPALLGVLERRRFTRVGGSQEIDVDVRVLAATNRDLRAEVNAGSFRADLYYRLAVARIVIPPLRERPEDIEPLVRHFTEQLAGLPDAMPLAPQALDALRSHPWSGNVRELRNVVEGSLVMGQLSLDGMAATPAPAGPGGQEIEQYSVARSAAIARFERSYLENLIQACGGNASEAARRARMDRPYLLTLLRRHGLR